MAKPNRHDPSLPLIGHLAELRTRLIRSVVALGICSTASFYFADQILLWLRKPLSTPLVFLSPAEAFWATIKVALFAGLLLALPVILYELWKFVSPGLLTRERFALLPFLFLGIFGFAVGLLFSYFIALPFAINFLIDYGQKSGLTPMLSVSMYVDFNLKVLFGFGLIFELPLTMLLLTKLGLLTPAYLSRNRRYAIFLAFLAAAILTPTPDVFNLMIMALPLILLYEVGIWVSRIFGNPRKVKTPEEQPSE